jgi:hypothetical protein
MGRNLQTFDAVRDALAGGSAVGVFPEGVHPLRALPRTPQDRRRPHRPRHRRAAPGRPRHPPGGDHLPGRKERFRSEALVLVGKPVRWATWPPKGPPPRRSGSSPAEIEAAPLRVTVNLRDWDDLPIVEVAEAVHHAEFGRRHRNPVRWLARMRRTAQALERARESGGPAFDAPPRRALGPRPGPGPGRASPRALHLRPSSSVAVRWTLGNLLFFGFALPLALVGTVVFWVPWTVVRRSEPRFRLTPDRQATYRVLATAVTCGGWVLLLAALALEFRGWRSAVALLAILPLTGLLTLRIRTRWRSAILDLRRFLLLRGRQDVRSRLLADQRRLAERSGTSSPASDPPVPWPPRPAPRVAPRSHRPRSPATPGGPSP